MEVGTFTGYSALSIAEGFVDGGRLLCCDVSTEWTDIARELWAMAGLDDRIELCVAPGSETLGQSLTFGTHRRPEVGCHAMVGCAGA